MLKITMLLAAVLALLYVWLAVQVIQLRRKHHVSLGAGGHADLDLAIRAHGNFAEYVPLSLILLACAELNQAPVYLVVVFAVLVFAGRAMHAYGFHVSTSHMTMRVRGMMCTFAALVGMAVMDIALYFMR